MSILPYEWSREYITQTLKLGFGLIVRGPKAVYYPLCRLLIELWERPAPGKGIVFGLLIMRVGARGALFGGNSGCPSPIMGGEATWVSSKEWILSLGFGGWSGCGVRITHRASEALCGHSNAWCRGFWLRAGSLICSTDVELRNEYIISSINLLNAEQWMLQVEDAPIAMLALCTNFCSLICAGLEPLFNGS